MVAGLETAASGSHGRLGPYRGIADVPDTPGVITGQVGEQRRGGVLRGDQGAVSVALVEPLVQASVAIDIPGMLVYLRSRAVAEKVSAHLAPAPEAAAMTVLSWLMRGRRRWTLALRAARLGRVQSGRAGNITRLPGPLVAWTGAQGPPAAAEAEFPRLAGVSVNGSARAEIIGRTRAGRAATPPAPVPRDYHGPGAPAARNLVGLLAGRLADYGATVLHCGTGDPAAVIGAALVDRGTRRIVIPSGLPEQWAAAAEVPLAESRVSGRDGLAVLDSADAVVTVTVAIAQTGTLVLDHGPGQGAPGADPHPGHPPGGGDARAHRRRRP